MTANCRVGDMGVGVCYLHDSPVSYVTTFIRGSEIVLTDSLQTMRVNDIGVASCGHQTIALTGANVTNDDQLAIHRVGDIGTTGSGTYNATTGSLVVNTD